MLDERAEARLARAAVDLLGQRRALERERDLGGERAQRAALGLRRRVGRARRRAARRGSSRRGARARATGRGRASAGSRELVARRGASARRAAVGRGGEQRAAVAAAIGHGATAPARRRRRRRASSPSSTQAQRAPRRRRRRARTAASSAARSISSRLVAATSAAPARAEHALARDGALLLAHEAGHAQRRRGRTARPRRAMMTSRSTSPRRSSLDRPRRPARSATRTVSSARRSGVRRGVAVGRGLLELAHRRVQRGGAPQQVEADPADVEPRAGRRRRRAASPAP